MSLPFLLEIGTEEIPDWMIPGALESLRGQLESMGIDARMDATPRRLTARAQDLPERLPDTEERVTGPRKSAGEKALEGFARKQGVTPADLQLEAEYYTYLRKTPGRKMIDILADSLPGIILKIAFPKTMYWTGKAGPRFIRPIRWIVALLGGDVIRFELAGVRSGNETSGHRRLSRDRKGAVPVTIENYEQQLRDNFVILSAAERRKKIEDGIAALNVRLKPDPSLLETLVYLTEYPTPIVGEFDSRFLKLPKEVLITVMRHHQKYFSVEDESGHLAPRFVAVMNTSGDPEGLVRRGNERVLRARFNDARFFWQTDQSKKLADRVDDLAHVTFQAKLGSYLEKTRRVADLVQDLGGDEHARRAAFLAKCDLTTELVKEFTELQGVVGGLYARAQGEPEEVWHAIYDHYKPVSMEDSIPRSRTGQLVSLADKLDTLRECFRIGMAPTGSRDPFGLRRAAQGIVKILVEGKVNGPSSHLLGDIVRPQLKEFFAERVKFYFRDVKNFAYDEINAAMAAGWDDLIDLQGRLRRLQTIRPTPDFEPLAASFKRIKNILRQAEFTGGLFDPALLEPGPESDLFAEINRTAGQPIEDRIGALRPKVDLFFDKVLVNAPDPAIRANRLAMLHNVLEQFRTFADFSEIVTNS
ncbi:MAG TPA: glycine--tRNA ligase subunit beta [Bryobacteraceae bacterium]|nr:glycine--tRNA ligase subunit beta [Bryobacteraceae bacterium]